MKPFLGADFLLDTATARHLFHDVAEELPIVDFHNHLSAEAIANDRKWDNIGAIWLEGDHTKWRLMRWAGVDEALITGDADFSDKFKAFAKIMPRCLGNPLYHRTHLELQRYFGIRDVLNEDSADMIWEKTQAMLTQDTHSARGLLRRMNVAFVGTTNPPLESLEHHKAIADDDSIDDLVVAPSFQPDAAMRVHLPGFAEFISDFSSQMGRTIDSYDALLSSLLERLGQFVAHGCKASDHSINVMRFAMPPSHSVLDAIMEKGITGVELSELEIAQYQTALLMDLARAYCKHDLVMQLHIGAIRDTNHRHRESVGFDIGVDAISDRPIAAELNGLLGEMDRDGTLPRTILYCLDPSKLAVIISTAGNYEDGTVPGKIQAGSAWWLSDQLYGMERHMTQLSQMGLFSQFVGMLTDSRSFLSFPRHEYFRRLVCQKVGRWAEEGHIPSDLPLLNNLVRDVCYHNAANWFLNKP